MRTGKTAFTNPKKAFCGIGFISTVPVSLGLVE
jgi:hypothetical protein